MIFRVAGSQETQKRCKDTEKRYSWAVLCRQTSVAHGPNGSHCQTTGYWAQDSAEEGNNRAGTYIPDRKADYLNQEAVSNNLKWPFFKVHGSSELLNFLWLSGSNFQGMVTTVATWNFTPVVKVKTGHWLQVLFNLRIKQPLSSKAWR